MRQSSKWLCREFFAPNTLSVARALLGTEIVYGGCRGRIVETEAYRDDPASHALTRPQKGRMLYDTYGQVYIYFIYGMHHCLNFTTEKDGVGAVLIRAVEPTAGLAEMQRRRHTTHPRELANGPGKLFQAFGFDPIHHGEAVGNTIQLRKALRNETLEIVQTRRIGISKATELPWRFCIKGSRFLSKST